MTTNTWMMTNGTVATAASGGRVIADGSAVWQGSRIVAVGERPSMVAAYPEASVIDARGGLILPGLVNLHHHFYSALARGLDPGVPTNSFSEILEGLWWRLDRALDHEDVQISALLSAAECIRWGATTVFDHHASPSCIDGSLDLIAEAAQEAGLRTLLCYEVSDRNGHPEAAAGVAENLRFIDDHRDHPRVRGVLGLHASFTVSDQTLDQVAAERPDDAGCHIHLVEDPVDITASVQRFGARPLQRLLDRGLVDERALLAHGVHLEDKELDIVAARGATLIHNPESNQNNGVGRLDLIEAARHGCAVGLGTDGMSSAMLRALRAAFLGLRGARRDPSAGFDVLPGLLEVNRRVAGRFFDEPALGTLAPGAPADVVAVDCPAPTCMDEGNQLGHLLFGASEAPIRHTVAGGRLLLHDYRHTTLDPQALAEEARRRSPAMWQRFRELSVRGYLG